MTVWTIKGNCSYFAYAPERGTVCMCVRGRGMHVQKAGEWVGRCKGIVKDTVKDRS